MRPPSNRQQQTVPEPENNPQLLKRGPISVCPQPQPHLAWHDVCVAPCNVTVDPNPFYRTSVEVR
ncbi:MAG TPA: hypothetical protein VN903_25855 [Polyangia bacterium]|jgi:hypothetical protein|nr:hypothetical protein [Polyangia bacterium]